MYALSLRMAFSVEGCLSRLKSCLRYFQSPLKFITKKWSLARWSWYCTADAKQQIYWSCGNFIVWKVGDKVKILPHHRSQEWAPRCQTICSVSHIDSCSSLKRHIYCPIIDLAAQQFPPQENNLSWILKCLFDFWWQLNGKMITCRCAAAHAALL